MKNFFKIFIVTFIMSLVSHDVLPHAHHDNSLIFQLENIDSSNQELDNSNNSADHNCSSCCDLTYFFQFNNLFFVFDIDTIDLGLTQFFNLWHNYCILDKVKLKTSFIYFLNYKSPFVRTLNVLRAPPYFQI